MLEEEVNEMPKMKEIGFTQELPLTNDQSFFEFETDLPTPNKRDLIVKIKAISVNPVDAKTFADQKTALKQPKILGFDAVGTVYQTGSDVTKFNIGDEVYYAGSYIRPGSYAEYQAVDERIVAYAPKKLAAKDAASIPLTFLTAYESLIEKMHLSFSDPKLLDKTLLIINGAGGVGSAAIQLARLTQIRVAATASRPESIEWAKEMGADVVINHHENLEDQLMDEGALGVDYVLELHSLQQYFDQITDLINPLGTVVSITGVDQSIDLIDWKRKAINFCWEWMFARSYYQTADMARQGEILQEVADLLDEGKLKPTTTTVMKGLTAKNIRAAHQLLQDQSLVGKLVIEF